MCDVCVCEYVYGCGDFFLCRFLELFDFSGGNVIWSDKVKSEF